MNSHRAGMQESVTAGKRAAYHHGNLRDHLIDAARSLIDRNGQEQFRVADACRHAGVSTAAPYRHFADRQAMLYAVAVAGFDDLHNQMHNAGEQLTKGSVQAVGAIGKAYVAFASHEPNMFRLMFGQSEASIAACNQGPDNHDGHIDVAGTIDAQSACAIAGRRCYEVLLDQLAVTLKQETINESVVEAAFPLWTFVHGLSFLVIDGKLSVNRMSIDINDQIDRATERLMPV